MDVEQKEEENVDEENKNNISEQNKNNVSEETSEEIHEISRNAVSAATNTKTFRMRECPECKVSNW